MNYPRLAFVAFAFVAAALSNRAGDPYPLTADSQPQAGVPAGELIKFDFADSKIFPGTTHEVTVYVPKQYDPAKPACVYVNQDGMQWHANVVFDNLIARHELPVIVGVFVRPGIVKAADPEHALDRYNRTFEYDGLGDGYARFLLDELLPAVEAKQTADGRSIHLSHSGNDRAIGGSSSGAIAAFTAAWERSDAFTRVWSAIGTYVDLRGGARYPTLIRKYEPKPLRIFLQDGSNDLNIYGGDWWMANQTMERALEFAGYEVMHAWGEGGHSGAQGDALFPDVMRTLWKGWPEPVKRGQSKNQTLAALLIPGEEWEFVGEGYQFTEGPAVNAQGEVFFHDCVGNRGFKVSPEGKAVLFRDDPKKATGAAFGPDGRMYTVAVGTPGLYVYDNDGTAKLVTDGVSANDIIVAHNGNIYVTDTPAGAPSKVVLIRPDGSKQVVDPAASGANGLVLSADQTQLYVGDWGSHWLYVYSVQPDGTLANKQRYGWLHLHGDDDHSMADGIRVDREGRVYVATGSGVQVLDQVGRVQCILPTPNGKIANLAFGGEKFDTLYALCVDKVYRRKLHTTGCNAWDVPVKPAAPHL